MVCEYALLGPRVRLPSQKGRLSLGPRGLSAGRGRVLSDWPFDALGIEFPTGGVRSVDNYVGPTQCGRDRTGSGTDSSGHKILGARRGHNAALLQAGTPSREKGRSLAALLLSEMRALRLYGGRAAQIDSEH